MCRIGDGRAAFAMTVLVVSSLVGACGETLRTKAAQDGGNGANGGNAGSSAGSGGGTSGGSAGQSGSSGSGATTSSGGLTSRSGAGGTTGSGGASTGGQSSSSGGAGADAGGPCSSVSFHLISREPIDGGSSFCVGNPNCGSAGLLTVFDSEMNVVTLGLECNDVDCTSCRPTLCPPNPCSLSRPLPSSGEDLTWDGTVWLGGGECNGLATGACFSRRCAPPGHYVARLCAFPLAPNSDGGLLECERHASPTPTCIDVPFDYPATTTVTGTLDPRM